MNAYACLGLAIVCEVTATSLLKTSQGFSKLWPTLGSIAGYLVSFFFLSITLKTIPTGVAYAIWSGIGIVLISIVGRVAFHQRLDLPALLGMGLIAAGVIVINMFSKSAA